ncbi:MAG: monovalent cation/H(+) antiporter subunit G [Bacillota bacterium]|nr:monovalent cation/H(+) antiporter subunit G [Bacillota bacterium]
MMIDLMSKFLIASGLFFFLVGTIGILRFPDALTRAHGAAKADTLGAVLCILGLVLQSGFSPVTLKLILIICFLWTANPTATHMIARAIYSKNFEEE